jgi:flagellar biogenesis protein FliO
MAISGFDPAVLAHSSGLIFFRGGGGALSLLFLLAIVGVLIWGFSRTGKSESGKN